MARITERAFCKAVGAKLGKSDTMVEKYMKAIIEQIFKEMNRGNTVTIKRFASFEPILVGGKEMWVCGERKYVEPRITIDFSLTKAGLQIMNNMILDYDTKQRIKDNRKLMPYEKEIIGEPIEEKKNLEEVFNKIISEMEEKYSNQDEEESEDFEEDGETDV
jgi:hypothetical protein